MALILSKVAIRMFSLNVALVIHHFTRKICLNFFRTQGAYFT